MNLPRLILTLAESRIEALVARSEEDREQGLMECRSLGPDEGMLFVQDEAKEACFWMKDTPLDLSVAFIDEQGRILNVEDMEADSLESKCAAGPARYVLEMRLGWFGEHGIRAGDTIEGLPPLEGVTPPASPAAAA
ncbi:DUF192 domain-containing protein [Caenimonas sedimenti]|uniref:DUF192 domain-containing protein n=1 Tax=Caenimonas sedimenti TaxID=2596921 RepID=A0A562ZQ81_9BURK|nr:DUF192 domain-containing protein [Caenimonas sedimenti]TWO70693.1 DUF192 domain-containing protein [Caenimonas sedimenti]